MRRMWPPWQARGGLCVPFLELQAQSSLCSPFLRGAWGRGAEVEGMKICPAAIVSQLFPSDSSGWDSSPEPLRLGGIQCIPDDNPRDSRPCLCAASPRALARTGPHRSGPGRCHLVLTSFLRSGRDCSEVWKFSSNSKILSFRSCPFA